MWFSDGRAKRNVLVSWLISCKETETDGETDAILKLLP